MAWTQADVDQLKTNMAKGVTSATFNGETVVFRSLDEMRDLLSTMQRSLRPASSAPAVKTIYPTTSRGL